MPIQVLPPQLANQIAAGEVVERPASVVKELVENSLDAGAIRIDIEIERGGAKMIRIRDNGCGIGKDELALALARHATSKITCLDDLECITSMGFRGEALASVSSVSRLTLTSRTADQNEAWQAHAEGREMAVTLRPAAHPVGSTVEVLDLFYNTPARRKFMRTEKTEFAHIDEVIRRIALARFDVTFILQHNGKTVRQYRAVSQQSQHLRRLGGLCGAAFVERALAVSWNHGDLAIRGWVADPAGGDLPEMQYSYVNQRMMRDKLINHAIRQAYQEQLAGAQQPAFVLFLEVDPHQVDVNVHPAKHEVRFHQARLVHDFIYQAVVTVLQQSASPRLAGGDAPASRAPENRQASGRNHFATPTGGDALDGGGGGVGESRRSGGGEEREDATYSGASSASGNSVGELRRDAGGEGRGDAAYGGASPASGGGQARERGGGYQKKEGELYRRLIQPAGGERAASEHGDIFAPRQPADDGHAIAADDHLPDQPATGSLSQTGGSSRPAAKDLFSPSTGDVAAPAAGSGTQERSGVSFSADSLPVGVAPAVAGEGYSFGKVLTLCQPCYALLESAGRLALLSLPVAERCLTERQLTPDGDTLRAQPLLIPLRMTLRGEEAEALKRHHSLLQEMGIVLQLHQHQAILNAVPLPLRQQNLQNLIPELLGYLSGEASTTRHQVAAWLARWLNRETIAWSHSRAIQLLAEVERLCPQWVKTPPDELLVTLNFEAAIQALNHD